MGENNTSQPAAADQPDRGSELPMPPSAEGVVAASPQAAATNTGGSVLDDLPPPPTFSRQMAQLVVIPALIMVACVGTMLLFGLLIGHPDRLEDQLLRLRQSSGMGKIALGVQDPRYKDRWMAAANVAQMMRSVEDPQQRATLSNELVEILDQNVAPEEDLLQLYLLMALGQLGQPGGMEAIVAHFDAPHERARQGAIRGVMSWPDPAQARAALPALRQAVASDASAQVRAEAAVALGVIAESGDQETIVVLRDALGASGAEMRELPWNAAVALARLGDERGSDFVVHVLLDRNVLARMKDLTPEAQDRVMLSTLASVATMGAPAVWEKVEQLAQSDPSRSVQNAARQMLHQRSAQPQE